MITALGPRLGLGLRLDFGSQVWFVQYFSEKKVIVLYGKACSRPHAIVLHHKNGIQGPAWSISGEGVTALVS